MQDQLWEQGKAWWSCNTTPAELGMLTEQPRCISRSWQLASSHFKLPWSIYILYIRSHDILYYSYNSQDPIVVYFEYSQSHGANTTWSVDLTCLHGLNGFVYTAGSHGTLCPVLSTFAFWRWLLMWAIAVFLLKLQIHQNLMSKQGMFSVACWLYMS